MTLNNSRKQGHKYKMIDNMGCDVKTRYMGFRWMTLTSVKCILGMAIGFD